MDEIGFERLQTLILDGDVAMESDSFGNEFFELSFSHNRTPVEISCRSRSGALAPELARHEGSTPGFLLTWLKEDYSFSGVLGKAEKGLSGPAKIFDRVRNRGFRPPLSGLSGDSSFGLLRRSGHRLNLARVFR